MEMNAQAEDLATATVQIIADDARGSGFHFINPEILVTNHHVVVGATDVTATAVNGATLELEELGFSPENEDDYAIYRVISDLDADVRAIQPNASVVPPPRGARLTFAGFPHGIDDLLVQEAIVAGPCEDDAFYMDGSVNGGNSGGPVVDSEGLLVGIVTQRRFLSGSDLEAMSEEAEQLAAYCGSISGAQVLLMGIDFGQFAGAVSKANKLLAASLMQNANTGLGIAFCPGQLLEECTSLGLT
jgi:S1-C subfamily serine protease